MMARMKHKPLGREMLLPLRAQKARALSLEYHLALSVLAAGDGSFDQAATLLQAIWHARFLAGREDVNVVHLAAAESALDAMSSRVDAGEAWTVNGAEHTTIARGLSIHDQLTAREPYHRFVAAWAQMQHLARESQETSTSI
jgi:hypothetical protein